MVISKRSIGMSILLSFLTVGVYLIYWEYKLVKNVKALKNDTSGCAGEMLCLLFVPFYSYYWWYTRGKTVKEEFSARSLSCSGNETAYLLLFIFGLGLIAVAIMQNDFNSIPSGICISNETSVSDSCAVVGMVCGIIGLVVPIPFLPFVFAIAGIVISSISLIKGAKSGYKGMAIAGLVCSIIGFVINIVSIISFLWLLYAMKDTLNNAASSIYY